MFSINGLYVKPKYWKSFVKQNSVKEKETALSDKTTSHKTKNERTEVHS